MSFPLIRVYTVYTTGVSLSDIFMGVVVRMSNFCPYITIISIVFIFILWVDQSLKQTTGSIWLLAVTPLNWLLMTVVGILSLAQFHTPLSIQCQNNKQDKGSITPSAVPSISFFNMDFQHFPLVLNLSRSVWYTQKMVIFD